MVFIPKDDHIKSIFERLEKDKIALTDFDSAKQLSRYKQIRAMRQRDEILIGMDRKKKISIIYSKRQIRRKGKGFLL